VENHLKLRQKSNKSFPTEGGKPWWGDGKLGGGSRVCVALR